MILFKYKYIVLLLILIINLIIIIDAKDVINIKKSPVQINEKNVKQADTTLIQVVESDNNALTSEQEQESILIKNPDSHSKRKYIEHKKRIHVDHSEWHVERITHDYESVRVELTIAIKQRNLNDLETYVSQVSDVSHKNYGKYLSFQEIKEMVAPEEKSIQSIKAWLDAHGILNHELSESGDFLIVRTNLDHAERLLHVNYDRYVHRSSKISFIRSSEPYSVPEELFDHIDFIGGVNHLPLMSKSLKPSKSMKTIQSLRFPIDYDFELHAQNRTDPFLSPFLIRNAMNVPPQDQLAQNNPKSSQAIAQFLEEYFSPEDLQVFQSKFKFPQQNITAMLGINHESHPGMETALDIQQIMAMSPLTPTWIVSVSGLREGQEPFLDWLVNMSSLPNLPLVHSVSYGDDESSIERSYTERVNVEFEKYAAMGRTIVFSSGDSGVGCTDACDQYVPGWPASSPYVLSIGGVYMKKTSDNHMIGHQISGGGFSNHFERPSYQDREVKSYLDNHLLENQGNFFNASGRGYPDISSFSRSVIIVYKGNLIPIGGTSASAPIIAGVLTLLNNERFKLDLPPIGFFNPLLYKIVREHPDSVYDITEGENDFGCCSGFRAVKGWNPMVGLGVPNVKKLIKYATSI